jgi:L-lactate dehydrogenase complex protein LldF
MAIKIGQDPFFKRVENGINDRQMQMAVSSAQERFQERRQEAAAELGYWEEWRKWGEAIRAHTLSHLDYYLEQLSENVSKAGGHVFFAQTAAEANDYITQIIKRKKANRVVKSKSMVTEEISLNEALEEAGCEVLETDLAEFILQSDDHDPPSHIVVPSLHKDREKIRKVFTRLGYQGSSVPEEMTRFARTYLREKFLSADVGITGCNFAVAESGTVVLVTNEGNARLCTTLPKTQITVMGMERLVPTWEELDVLVTLLCRSAVGQKLTTYVTGLTGPRRKEEGDGPEEFHLVIIDNGRSDILGTEFQSILHCIRCAACINVCPVYRYIGGHSYGSIYPGPIGAVLTPLLAGYDEYKELPYASSVCAACTEVCPVRIPLHELLIKHRRKIVEEEKKSPLGERLAMKGFRLAATSPKLYHLAAKTAFTMVKPLTEEAKLKSGPGPLKAWTEKRDFPAPQKETFREWFYKRQQKGEES